MSPRAGLSRDRRVPDVRSSFKRREQGVLPRAAARYRDEAHLSRVGDDGGGVGASAAAPVPLSASSARSLPRFAR